MVAFSTDPVASSPGLRTLGTGAQQAASGADSRLQGRSHQMATYTTPTNPSQVYFTAVATDGVTVIVPRTAVGVHLIAAPYRLYGYDMPLTGGLTDYIAVWDEGDTTDYTLAWEFVGGSAATTGGTGGTTATASFTVTQTTSSQVTLDASASTADTYAWTVDGVARPETTAVVTYGPLAVASHTFRLDTTKTSDGSTANHSTTTGIAWYGNPGDMAQVDNVDGIGAGAGMSTWSPLPTIGPWRYKSVLNQATGTGDGTPRIVSFLDGSITILTKTTDTAAASPGMFMNDTYNGSSSGGTLAVSNITAIGNVVGGVTGPARFIRVEYNVNSHNADASACPTGTALFNSQVKFGELAAQTAVVFPTLKGGPNNAIAFRPNTLGVAGTTVYFDDHALVQDSWYNYVIEYVLSTDPAVGYVRVYRDGVVVTSVPAGTDGTGKYFAQTQPTNSDSSLPAVYWSIQNARAVGYLNANPGTPDQTIGFRNVRIGPTLASVYP